MSVQYVVYPVAHLRFCYGPPGFAELGRGIAQIAGLHRPGWTVRGVIFHSYFGCSLRWCSIATVATACKACGCVGYATFYLYCTYMLHIYLSLVVWLLVCGVLFSQNALVQHTFQDYSCLYVDADMDQAARGRLPRPADAQPVGHIMTWALGFGNLRWVLRGVVLLATAANSAQSQRYFISGPQLLQPH